MILRSSLIKNIVRSMAALLTIVALSISCTGTPMPIPPSLDVEQFAIESISQDCPDFGLECISISGAEGAAEPGAVLLIHSLHGDFFEVDPFFEFLVADVQGAFETVVSGQPDGIYRLIAHTHDASLVTNMRADTTGPEPWPIDFLDDEEAGNCLSYNPELLDFGSLDVGETSTQMVELENNCGVAITELQAYTRNYPDISTAEAFESLIRFGDLEPGEATDVVVVFWPEREGDQFGAVVVRFVGYAADDSFLSIPIRGQAISR